MKRQIIEINQEKCIGCGLCANACHQGAIQIIDGKAKLVSDSYCDGLGMCLPACPVDAIKLTQKETVEFDQSRKGYAVNKKKTSGGCPGSISKVLKNNSGCGCSGSSPKEINSTESQLNQWPVQLKLVSPLADFWDNADILIAADCCAYSYSNFHTDFMKNKITVIGCPKLDDNQYYIDKLTEIFSTKNIKSITVTRMSVPCCSGLVRAVKEAISNSNTKALYNEFIISTDGNIIS
ncbi:MAG: 4Fe-4S binding protein [Tepidibacter sp.]|jgi:Pyruvate/2-oxoacid:ferredoxin oxidoreductase delta subunit|uniref:ATP-binding protein n=1 Tax=Tepidibacter sp. TaxID=2529387 RepID=UPI0025FC14FF|nr:4Fe-4S binding protein [Tepidibacter sp.]MCT4509982.1 4Fe-4S binding protein [Tepidibacter sp.]